MVSKDSEGYPEQLCATEEISELACPNLYLNREINWLDFDAKVLDEATDAGLPLLEQLKFLSIFYNNLDEFFMVRVANIYRQYRSGAVSSSPDRMTPAKQLAEIRRKVLILVSRAQEHWRKRLAPQLHDKGVRLMRYADLSEKQRKFLDGYFRNEIYPILTPQAIDPGHPFPTISNTSLNFIIQLRSRDGVTRFARLKCPNNISRFVFIPRNKEAKTYASLGFNANVRDSDIILLEDLIAEYLGALFPGNTVVNAGLFRITRNTDVEIEEDEADDLLEAVKDLVEQRRFGDVVRLEIAHGTAKELSAFLTERLGMQPFQIYRVKGPLAFSELMALYGVDRPGLKESPFYGRTPSVFQEGDIYAHIQSRDVFLFHPYDSFTPVLDFIRRSSEDPGVKGISDNIEVTSIVGRFLEHTRVYWFNANGEGRLYIGSADIMPRNLDRRIEVLVPILDPGLRACLRNDILETHLRDNQQTWRLQEDGTYCRIKPGKGEEPVNAQEIMMRRSRECV